jgi:hypothetical protein
VPKTRLGRQYFEQNRNLEVWVALSRDYVRLLTMSNKNETRGLRHWPANRVLVMHQRRLFYLLNIAPMSGIFVEVRSLT